MENNDKDFYRLTVMEEDCFGTYVIVADMDKILVTRSYNDPTKESQTVIRESRGIESKYEMGHNEDCTLRTLHDDQTFVIKLGDITSISVKPKN
jgi:hypothetical protein